MVTSKAESLSLKEVVGEIILRRARTPVEGRATRDEDPRGLPEEMPAREKDEWLREDGKKSNNQMEARKELRARSLAHSILWRQ